MAGVEFFQRMGLFAVPAFLDAAACAEILEIMAASQQRDATVGSSGPEYTVDSNYRRSKVADVADSTRELIAARLRAVTPAVSAHYGLALADVQRPMFLTYHVGDFYKPHRDGNSSPTGAALSKARKVAAVIFLNAQSADPRDGHFGDGALTFYELFPDPAGRNLGVPLEPEPGLLITFPADQLHAVAPVSHGKRHTVVSWYV